MTLTLSGGAVVELEHAAESLPASDRSSSDRPIMGVMSAARFERVDPNFCRSRNGELRVNLRMALSSASVLVPMNATIETNEPDLKPS